MGAGVSGPLQSGECIVAGRSIRAALGRCEGRGGSQDKPAIQDRPNHVVFGVLSGVTKVRFPSRPRRRGRVERTGASRAGSLWLPCPLRFDFAVVCPSRDGRRICRCPKAVNSSLSELQKTFWNRCGEPFSGRNKCTCLCGVSAFRCVFCGIADARHAGDMAKSGGEYFRVSVERSRPEPVEAVNQW